MAGLRRPSAPESATADHPDVTEAPELETTEAEESDYAPPVWREPATRSEQIVAPPVIDEPGPVEDVPAEDAAAEDAVIGMEPAPAPRARPSGKRRAMGSTQPADLAAAEAEVSEPDLDEAPPANPTLVRAIGLGVAVLLLVAMAIWFRGEANSRSEGADANNQALIDTAKSSEAVGQVRDAIEKSLSYNYTDLESTARAVKDNLAGRALCEYDQLFGQVKKLAPQESLVLTTRVRDIGVTRLEGDQAMLLVFVDQTTTRANQNQTTASGAQFAVRAERQGDRWRITQFDMLGQPLPNGQPLPQC